MRRLLAAILPLAMLAGCGGQGGILPPEGAEIELWEEEAPSEGLRMELEHPAYDPSLAAYTYLIYNGTEETVEFGAPYGVQHREGERWIDLTARENRGFTDIGYSLSPGGTLALTCWMGMFEEPPEPGEYRLVKEVSGQTLYAEFRLGQSAYTAQAPYGFGPLEDLPETYGADTASEMDVVFAGDGIKNPGAVEDFLFKTGLGAPGQLRTVQDYGEGAAIVTDVIYENQSYLRRSRSGGMIIEQRFSYLVTDGEELYLSNGADWAGSEKYGGQQTRLIPEGASKEMLAAVEEATARRLEGGAVWYRTWSGDGLRSAALTDVPTEFLVEQLYPDGGRSGGSHDLMDWDGTETEILGLAWQKDGTLLLECETIFGARTRYLRFDPETEQVTSVKGGLLESGERVFRVSPVPE